MTEEQRRLCEENYGLIDSFFNIYPTFDKDKYWDVAAIGLCKACMSGFKGKSSFKTYAVKAMKNEIINEISKETAKRNSDQHILFSLDEDLELEDNNASRANKPCLATFDNDPYYRFVVKDVLENAGFKKSEKIVFLMDCDLTDKTDLMPSMKSQVSRARKSMRKKLEKYYFNVEKTA